MPELAAKSGAPEKSVAACYMIPCHIVFCQIESHMIHYCVMCNVTKVGEVGCWLLLIDNR